jgi:hypothetical protein
MDCERYRDGMARRVTGLLAASEEEDLSRHLADCAGCRGESARLMKLVAVLGAIPEEDWSEAPRKVRPRGAVWMPLAAAVLVAVGVSVAAPFLGARPRLEGDFVRGSDGTWSAANASAAVEMAGHRCVCRKDTRIRLVGPKELFLEEGRLDVSGSGREFRIGTPLGPVQVVGTDFVVEVKTVKKGSIAGGVIVGILVSSGVVSYADLRLERGQAAIEETGRRARPVDPRALENRLRVVQENGRDLERKLAALEFEKAKLAADLAAAQSGKLPAAAVKLTSEDRRDRFRKMARMFVRENAPYQVEHSHGDGKDEGVVSTDRDVDPKVMTEALSAANDLGIPIFSLASALVHPEFANEVLVALLQGKEGSEAVHRSLAEAAVQQGYASIKESYEFEFEKSLAALQAFGRALDQVSGCLPPERAARLYESAMWLVSSGLPTIAPSSGTNYTPEAMAGAFADALRKSLEVDDAQAPILRQAVTEWYPSRLRDALPEKPTSRELVHAILRSRERNAELARRLIAVFPDRKGAIEKLFSW